jgi:nucleotide-binding universal stress UspA family protein
MERILVALDGSEHSEKALGLASDIASKYDAELVLLHVLTDKPLSDAERHMAEVEYLDEVVSSLDVGRVMEARGDPRVVAQRVLSNYSDVARRLREAMGNRLVKQARSQAKDQGVQKIETALEDGDPAEAILRVAKGRGVDMVVLGSRGLSDAQGLLLGSVSHKVAHLAECTCVTVK